MSGPRWRCLSMALLITCLSSTLSHPAARASAWDDQVGVRRGGVVRLAERHQILPASLAPVVRQALARTARGWMEVPLTETSAYTWMQQAELTATAETANDGFGTAVAVSGDTAIVGASSTPYPSDIGAAYIFARSGGMWTLQATLADPGGLTGDGFGGAVAISGTTAVIGALGQPAGFGAAYVYVRRGTTWTLQATLTASDAMQPEDFGYAVAISGDTVAVGAYGKNNGRGAVYVYVRHTGAWSQQAELVYPPGPTWIFFGHAVALDGETLVVGAEQAQRAYVYGRSAGVWSQQAVLRDPQPSLGLYFGDSVGVSGPTVVVGACCDYLEQQVGAAYVFASSGGAWNLQATLTPSNGVAGDSFGSAVALSGHTAVVGGAGANVFVGQGGVWTQRAQLSPSDRSAESIGAAVAVSAGTAVVGAPGTLGAAYVFVRSGASSAAADDAGMLRAPMPTGHRPMRRYR